MCIRDRVRGWYTDHCIRRIELPVLMAGDHVLEVEIPYNSRTNIENMFVLGNFTVEIFGTRQILKKAGKTLAFADLTRQGYPFYGGNVTYRLPFVSKGETYQLDCLLYTSSPDRRYCWDPGDHCSVHCPVLLHACELLKISERIQSSDH